MWFVVVVQVESLQYEGSRLEKQLREEGTLASQQAMQHMNHEVRRSSSDQLSGRLEIFHIDHTGSMNDLRTLR